MPDAQENPGHAVIGPLTVAAARPARLWGCLLATAIGLGVYASASAAATDACAERALGIGVHLSVDGPFHPRCVSVSVDKPDLDRSVQAVTIVGDYAATLHRGESFRGSQTTYVDDAVVDHHVGSISLRRGGCDGSPGVYLYEKQNHRGRCSRFTSDARSLYEEYILAREASSIRMVGDYRATLYASGGFHSRGTTFNAADRNLGNNGIGDDRARSMRVRPRHQVCGTGVGALLYAGAGFTGVCSRFTSTTGSLAGTEVGDDSASSIRTAGPTRPGSTPNRAGRERARCSARLIRTWPTIPSVTTGRRR